MKTAWGKEKIIFFVFTLVVSLLLSVGITYSEPPKIVSIKIKGNKRIEESAIRYMLVTKVGDLYSPKRIRKDIGHLYDSGYFNDIRVDRIDQNQGVELIYTVVERPIVERIEIIGNKDVESKDIEEKLGITPHSVLNQFSIKSGVQKIKHLYQEKGFCLTEVKPIIKDMVGNRVRLEIKISEGKKFKIGKIEFIGNKAFSAKRLKKAIQTKEKSIISSIFGRDLYRPDLVKDDLIRLQAFYSDHGFIDTRAKLLPIKIDPSKEKVNLKIEIQEGAQYIVGKVDIQGEGEIYTAKELSEGLMTKPNTIFSRAYLKDDVQFLTNAYTQKGFAFAKVDPLTYIDREKKQINIIFAIDRGEKMYIGRINIRGNTKTKDKIIRREIPLNEGEIYNSQLINVSKRRLKSLGYFEEIEINSERRMGEDSLMDIDIDLIEKPTGNISFGGGFSTSSSLLGTAGIEQNNLFGTGLRANIGGQLGGYRSRYGIGLTQPYLFDYPVSGSLNLYNRIYGYPYYDVDRKGSEVSLGKNLFEFVHGNVGVKYERVKLRDIDYDAPTYIKNSRDSNTVSSLTLGLSRNTYDNPLFPEFGSRIFISTELAGGLSEDSFYKTDIGVSKFFPLFPLKKLVPILPLEHFTLRLRGDVGFASGFGKDLPVYERYYLGGDNTLRGYDFQEVGPKGESGDAVGGDSTFLGSAELYFPIPMDLPYVKVLKGVGFFDIGDVFAKGDMAKAIDLFSHRKSVGLGVRVGTPMGPVRLDWAYKLDKGRKRDRYDEEEDKRTRWHFGFGSSY
jgi:outer membrane protein insertion porin family